jgi:hypothetical protein
MIRPDEPEREDFMTKAYPFFRADHVGSLLRTPELMEARQKWKAGELAADALQAVEDEAIAGVAKPSPTGNTAGRTGGLISSAKFPVWRSPAMMSPPSS